MYIPAPNLETDTSELKRFIRANNFGTLATMTQKGLIASHIPFVLHECASGFGVLRGHLARGNSQWSDFDPNAEALAIFVGPHHFISASWYPSKKIHGKVVPTWNYIAVHAYGSMRVVDDPEWLLEHLKTLVNENERIVDVPWSVSDAPPDFVASQMRGIVGIEINMSRVEGKWKLSQNRNDEDAAGVVAGLRKLKTPDAQVMSELIQQRRVQKS